MLIMNEIFLQTTCILTLLICIPAGLKLHSVRVKMLRAIDNEGERIAKYRFWSRVRLAIMLVPLLLNLALYLITKNASIAYCVGISVLALLFCIPGRKRMLRELDMTSV